MKTLASDKRVVMGSLTRSVTKISRAKDVLLGYAGDCDGGEALLSWFRAGCKIAAFPTKDEKDDWAELLVVWISGEIWIYGNTVHPLKFPPQQIAIGSGRDYAMAAMYMGATAVEAVGVAAHFDGNCGHGFDALTHKKGVV